MVNCSSTFKLLVKTCYSDIFKLLSICLHQVFRILDTSARPLAVQIGNCGAVQGRKYQTLLCSYKRGYTCRGQGSKAIFYHNEICFNALSF